MKNRLLFFFIVLLTTTSLFAQSGTCGQNLTWTLQDSVLIINGTGDMNHFGSRYDAPWSSYNLTIASIIIDDGVTSIGSNAFYNCWRLTSVTIPNSVTTIGSSAFYNCTGLTSVTIPNSVTTIGQYAFYNCSNLAYVFLSDSLTSIEPSTFDNCTGLTSITIPNSVTSIGRSAFYNCIGLTSVTIPNSVTTIGSSAFYNCIGLTSITIPNSVTSIGRSAFYNCSNLAYVFLSDSLTSIEESTFNSCRSLSAITIPNSVTSIGSYTFYNCTGLTSITIPNSVKSIGSRAFQGCSKLSSIIIPDSVTCIWDHAFSLCKGLTSVTIPNSVKYIHMGAFSGCTGLPSLTIPDSVTSIGNDACHNVLNIFYNGTANGSPWGARYINKYVEAPFVYEDGNKNILLGCATTIDGHITIPNSITNVEGYAFKGCTGLTSITIPSNVNVIGDHSFYGCIALDSIIWNANNNLTFSSSSFVDVRPQITSFVFGDSVQNIPDSLCSGMTKLSFVSISENVETIGSNAFSGCSAIDSVIWNAHNFADFTNSPFYDAHDSIVSVSFGDNVQYIPANLCKGMNRLKEITIPASVESIGDSVFAGCDSLTKVDISNLAPWCQTDFISCNAEIYVNGTKPTRLDIPEGVTRIGAYTFRNCKQVRDVVLPSSVTEIGEGGFANGNRLQTVTFDAALETIGDNAFNNCPYLLTIYANMEFPPVINYNVFANCGALSGIDCYVPQPSLPLYRKTAVWNSFHLIGTQAFVVTFLDWDGTVLSTQNIEQGADATPPANPSRNGYSFIGWGNDYTNIQGDKFVIAQYDKQLSDTIPVYFVDEEDNVLLTSYIMNAAPDAPVVEAHTFTGWEVVAGNISNGITIRATYEQDSQISIAAHISENNTQKIWIDGHLYIHLPNGTCYDSTGKRVE